MGHQPGAYELGLRIVATWARVSPGVRAPGDIRMYKLATNELRDELQRDNARLLKRVWKVAWHPENCTIAMLMDQNLRLRLVVSIMVGRSMMVRPKKSRRRSFLLETPNDDPASLCSRVLMRPAGLNGHSRCPHARA